MFALQNKPTHKVLAVILFAAAYLGWIAMIVIGHMVLFEYEFSSGPFCNTKRIWPIKAKLKFVGEKLNIVMFIHPMCPCTGASVAEFQYLLREAGSKAVGEVVVMMPPKYESDWSTQPIMSTIRRIRHVSITNDPDGSEAQKFGAETSGHVFVYDERGVLQFSGGITGMRGHEGNNANFQKAETALRARQSSLLQTPVFGCSLR